MEAVPTRRAEALAGEVAKRGLDALVVGDLVRPGDSGRDAMADLIWLTGFSGTSGLALVGSDLRLFVTDSRYAERARTELPSAFDLRIAERQLVPELAAALTGTVGFDPTRTSVREQRRLREEAPDGVELVEAEGLVEGLRRVKDDREVAAITEAARLVDEVYSSIEAAGLVGRSEREVAVAAEARMRELGAQAPAFPPIVAGGPNGSYPHAEPGDRVIEPGELVVVDAIAREVIEHGGHGEHFGHGLGHGVGVEVHEAPRISKSSDDELRSGDVVTVEPGIYVPGRFGVRIEDLLVVGDGTPRNLSGRPKELTVVG